MRQSVNLLQFREAFKSYGRESQFSFDGLGALFDYLESFEDETDEEYILDVIALCCDYSEYESMDAFRADYGEEYETMDNIRDRTAVIPVSSGRFIIADF